MWAVLGLAAAAGFVILVLHFAGWVAQQWAIFLTLAAVLSFYSLSLWHKRRIAELQQYEMSLRGRWRRAHFATHWPMVCQGCGLEARDWKSKQLHDNPDRPGGHCIREWQARAEREMLPATVATPAPPEPPDPGPDPAPETIHLPPAEATVMRGAGDGAVDTAAALDGHHGQAGELDAAQLDPPPGQAVRPPRDTARWDRLDELASRTMRGRR